MMEDMKCEYCGSTRLIKTSEGYKCRDVGCEGAKQTMQKGIICECGEKMDYRGLNSWGEPSYKCPECGTTVKL